MARSDNIYDYISFLAAPIREEAVRTVYYASDYEQIIAEKSYDAWGRYRHADTWEPYAPTYADMTFYRGYTGHEYIPEFGIINMNDRLYDPLLGRMFSPDPYIQEFQNTQNYNRYAYVLNNPLKYTDPSGQFFILDDWLIGFVGGFFSTGSHRWSAAWHSANLRAGNEAKVWGGLFNTDPHRTFFGNVWKIFSRFTREAPQTWLGWGISSGRNFVGDVDDVSYWGGATLVNKQRFGLGWGFTLGPYINSKNVKADPYGNQLFRHEYGHTLQSEIFGPLYLTHVALSSLLSEAFDKHVGFLKTNHNHDYSWFETNANRLSKKYFENHEPEALNHKKGGTPWNKSGGYPTQYKPDWFWWLIWL